MGLAKRIGKSERLRGALCWLASAYIRLVYATSRWTVVGGEVPAAFWSQGKPFIVAHWHNRILMMTKIWPAGRPIHMLVSDHRDGQLIARAIAHLGIGAIRGSTTRGGSQGLRTMLRTLRKGEYVGVTPDGPKGPRMHASAGVAALARLSGCPVIPTAVATARGLTLNSWDRFQVAAPFTRGIFIWGQAIDPAGQDEETLRAAIEAGINAVTAEADRRMGRQPVEPA